jgi:RecB family exonuclease
MRFNPTGDDSRQRIDGYLAETGHSREAESYKSSTYAWNPNDHDDSILRVTKSSYGTFNWCPQQYYLEKFKGLRGETVYYHTRGLNVHDMMEWFWTSFTGKEEALTLIKKGDIEKARAVLHDAIPQPPEPYEYGEDEQIAQWVDWQFHRLQYTKGEAWKPVATEANIQATRFVEVNGTHIPIHMNGFIDTIFSTGDDGFALMELKTGKWKKNKASNMRKEMAFYKMMLEHSPHFEFLPITHWGWEFPGGGIEGGEGAHIFYEDTKKGARFASKSVEKGLVRLVEAHINMEFPPDPYLGKYAMKCDYCSFKDDCEFWTVTDEYLEKTKED